MSPLDHCRDAHVAAPKVSPTWSYVGILCLSWSKSWQCHQTARWHGSFHSLVWVFRRLLDQTPRLPREHPVFADRELDEILRGGHKKPAGPPSGTPHIQQGGTSRKPLQEGDLCPICYDDIYEADLLQLTWCQKGCGQNIHGKCMQVWMAHSIKTQKVPSVDTTIRSQSALAHIADLSSLRQAALAVVNFSRVL